MTIDWSKPIEVVKPTGTTAAWVVSEPGPGRFAVIQVVGCAVTAQVSVDGRIVNSSWTVRNVAIPRQSDVPEHLTPTQYAPELVERAIAFARRAAAELDHEAGPLQNALQLEARSIVSDLPQEVDPNLIEARDCVVRAYEAAGRKDLAIVAASGKMDGRLRVQAALLAIARGRQLQRGEAA